MNFQFANMENKKCFCLWVSFWENPHNIQLDWPKFGILQSPRHIMDKVNKWHLYLRLTYHFKWSHKSFQIPFRGSKGSLYKLPLKFYITMLILSKPESFVNFSWKHLWMKFKHAPSERVWTHFSGCLPWRKNTEKEETGDLAHDNDNMYNFKLFIILASSDCIDTLTVSNFCANFFCTKLD